MKRSLINSALAVTLSLTSIVPVFAQTYNGQALQGRVTYVPVGTTLETVLASPIDSSVAKAGDMFNAKITTPLYLGNDLVLPANTMLEGQVTAAEKSGHAGISGYMGLHVTAAITPDGIRYPLSATIATQQSGNTVGNQDKQGNVHGSSKKAAIGTGTARTVAWAAGGTLLGICFAPIVAGSVAAGAVVGVTTGTAVGLGSNLWRKGKDVKIPSGTPVKFCLDQPMSLSTTMAGTAPAPLR